MIHGRRREPSKGPMNDLLGEGKGPESDGELPARRARDPAGPSVKLCPRSPSPASSSSSEAPRPPRCSVGTCVVPGRCRRRAEVSARWVQLSPRSGTGLVPAWGGTRGETSRAGSAAQTHRLPARCKSRTGGDTGDTAVHSPPPSNAWGGSGACAHPLAPQIPGCRRWVRGAGARNGGCRHPWQWATLAVTPWALPGGDAGGTPPPVPPRFPLLLRGVLPPQEARCRQRPAGGRACPRRQHRTSCDSDVTQRRHLSIFNSK